MKEKINELKDRYESAISDCLEFFGRKHGYHFTGWVGDEVGGVAEFGDNYNFLFSDIMYDINTNQPVRQIFDWHDAGLEYPNININYHSYCMGLRHKNINRKIEIID